MNLFIASLFLLRFGSTIYIVLFGKAGSDLKGILSNLLQMSKFSQMELGTNPTPLLLSKNFSCKDT